METTVLSEKEIQEKVAYVKEKLAYANTTGSTNQNRLQAKFNSKKGRYEACLVHRDGDEAISIEVYEQLRQEEGCVHLEVDCDKYVLIFVESK